MESTPCGCLLKSDALRASSDEASALLAVCDSRSRDWGCHGGEIHPDNSQTLRRLELISGCNRHTLNCCPYKAASTPRVVRALRLYRAQQTGGVSFDDDPPYSVFVGFEAVSDSDCKRIKSEQESKSK
jgi:hypothetical protein